MHGLLSFYLHANQEMVFYKFVGGDRDSGGSCSKESEPV